MYKYTGLPSRYHSTLDELTPEVLLAAGYPLEVSIAIQHQRQQQATAIRLAQEAEQQKAQEEAAKIAQAHKQKQLLQKKTANEQAKRDKMNQFTLIQSTVNEAIFQCSDPVDRNNNVKITVSEKMIQLQFHLPYVAGTRRVDISSKSYFVYKDLSCTVALNGLKMLSTDNAECAEYSLSATNYSKQQLLNILEIIHNLIAFTEEDCRVIAKVARIPQEDLSNVLDINSSPVQNSYQLSQIVDEITAVKTTIAELQTQGGKTEVTESSATNSTAMLGKFK